MNTNRLAARVKAVNAANAKALEVYDTLAIRFAPYVGSKIEKADGGLVAKVVKGLPEFPYSNNLHVYKYASNYSLVWMVKVCEQCDGNAYYHEAGVYIGEMRDGVLLKLCNRPELRTDYTVSEIVANREAYEAAQKIADDAKGKLHPFGEYDR
jgi:hypothetical protein